MTFLRWSLLFLFRSGVFHLAESFPKEYVEGKGTPVHVALNFFIDYRAKYSFKNGTTEREHVVVAMELKVAL